MIADPNGSIDSINPLNIKRIFTRAQLTEFLKPDGTAELTKLLNLQIAYSVASTVKSVPLLLNNANWSSGISVS